MSLGGPCGGTERELRHLVPFKEKTSCCECPKLRLYQHPIDGLDFPGKFLSGSRVSGSEAFWVYLILDRLPIFYAHS